MKNNVINTKYSIQFGQTGKIEILGKNHRNCLVVLVQGDRRSVLNNLYKQDYMLNEVFAYSLDEEKPTLVFEYQLNSELRNPRSLLKSIRNRIMAGVRLTEDMNRQHDEQQARLYPEMGAHRF